MTEAPIVGKNYLVPCVLYEPNGIGEKGSVWLPVFGPLHGDKEIIKFPERHWHLDWRFMSQRKIDGRGCHRAFIRDHYFSVPLSVSPRSCLEKEPTEKRLKCVREMPKYPISVIPWLKELNAAFRGQRVIQAGGCSVCPHRGLSLDGLGDDPKRTVCRGHGLVWNLENGELVEPPHG